MTTVTSSDLDRQPTLSRKMQSERYDEFQAATREQIDSLLQQAEEVATTRQFKRAYRALDSVQPLIGELASLRNRRGGRPRGELNRLVRYYELYRRALVGLVAAAKGDLIVARELLTLSREQVKQLRLDYPKSPEARQLARKIKSRQKSAKRP